VTDCTAEPIRSIFLSIPNHFICLLIVYLPPLHVSLYLAISFGSVALAVRRIYVRNGAEHSETVVQFRLSIRFTLLSLRTHSLSLQTRLQTNMIPFRSGFTRTLRLLDSSD